MLASTENQGFGKIRNFLWPIHGHEMKKFIPMFIMFFCVSFNYSMLRNMKDSLVITAPGSGAEIIPFLKLWGTTPMAILFTMLYMKLSSILTKERLFYVTLLPFVSFFILFPIFLYPNVGVIHPHASADYLQTVLPHAFHGFISIYRNWSFGLFYVLAELWGSFVLSVLFWTLANEITMVNEAKRFYGLFLLGANIALMAVAPAIHMVKNLREALPEGTDGWGFTINMVMGMMVFSSIIISVCYSYIRNTVMKDPRLYNPELVKGSSKKSKVKMGLIDSLAYLMKSKYLMSIALLVLSYGIAINLVEVSWKDHIKELYPNGADNLEFMGEFAFSTGLFTCLLLLVGTSNILRKFGWGKTAMITPIMLLITGGLYFINVIFHDNMLGLLVSIGLNPLTFVVLIGTAQNVLSKGCKYSFFDPTKEMAYIPLDDEGKVRGKAAIDGIGGRLGKSGGSLINMVLIMIFGSVSAITPYVAVIMAIIIAIWIVAVKYLGKEFNRITGTKDNA